MSFLDKIKFGMSKTNSAVSGRITGLFGNFSKNGEEFFEELEETLIMADLGVETSVRAVELLRERVKNEKLKTGQQALDALKEILTGRLLAAGDCGVKASTVPSVILVIGVNGVGKTTTIGKLASLYISQGKKVLLCAGDTFRAAAADQLEIWAKRSGSEIIRQGEGADPAAVVFDAISAARARGTDILICDTAGRLHNKQNLMNELSKIDRVISRELPGADRETLLVLDATAGQNSLAQAERFKEIAGVTGIVLTKLDGTAKGGMVVAIADALGIPVKFIGVGEKMDDLVPFDAGTFVGELI